MTAEEVVSICWQLLQALHNMHRLWILLRSSCMHAAASRKAMLTQPAVTGTR